MTSNFKDSFDFEFFWTPDITSAICADNGFLNSGKVLEYRKEGLLLILEQQQNSDRWMKIKTSNKVENHHIHMDFLPKMKKLDKMFVAYTVK